jgi:hypothetical protein
VRFVVVQSDLGLYRQLATFAAFKVRQAGSSLSPAVLFPREQRNDLKRSILSIIQRRCGVAAGEVNGEMP